MNTIGNCKRLCGTALYLLVILACPVPPVAAATTTFFSPASATATSTDLGSPTHLIDLSGISSTPVTLDNIGSVYHSNGIPADLWRANLSSTPLPITLTFDFTSAQRIDYIGLWQGYSGHDGVGDFNLAFWGEPNGTGNQIGSLYSSTLDTGSGGEGSIPLNGRSFAVGPRAGVESITMQVTSIAYPLDPYVHLGEFMVASSAVPIPAAAWLVGSALAGLGIIGRRKVKTK